MGADMMWYVQDLKEGERKRLHKGMAWITKTIQDYMGDINFPEDQKALFVSFLPHIFPDNGGYEVRLWIKQSYKNGKTKWVFPRIEWDPQNLHNEEMKLAFVTSRWLWWKDGRKGNYELMGWNLEGT